jgi:hypothetical protein
MTGMGLMPAITPRFKQVTLVDTASDSSNQTTYTFNGVSFGKPNASRMIIVAGSGWDSGLSADVSSITIGGVSATVAVQSDNTGNSVNGQCWIAYAIVPTGLTGTIVVNYDVFGSDHLIIGVLRATGLLSTVSSDTDKTQGSNPLALSVDVPARGFVVAAASSVSGSTISWNTGTEMVEGPESAYMSTMFTTLQFSSQSGKAISATHNGATSTNSKAVCASFG